MRRWRGWHDAARALGRIAGGRGVTASAHAAWVATRETAAPPALAGCVLETLAAHPEWEALELPEALVRAAGVLCGAVLRGEPTSRDGALLLLAADACVTYAFEEASAVPERVVARAQAAQRQLARFGE